MTHTNHHCPVCGGFQVGRYHNKIWSRYQGEVLQCGICDLLFLTDPMVKSDDVRFYQDYGAHLIARGVQTSDDPAELYEKMLPAARARLAHIGVFFRSTDTVLEVGASAGSFLGALIAHGLSPKNLNAVEPSDGHRAYSQKTLGITAFQYIGELKTDIRYDIVCMFHVFEHIADPQSFLKSITSRLNNDSTLIIEVPSHTDPLLSLYHLEAFKDFYFQPMHPVIYSPRSLDYVLRTNGFAVEKIIPYQRYGLDNHLRWLIRRAPGDNVPYSNILDEQTNVSYKQSLERATLTDTIFAIAHLKK